LREKDISIWKQLYWRKKKRSKVFEKERNKKRSNDASRCIHHRIASLNLSSATHFTTAHRNREETEATEECIYFFLVFLPVSFFPTWTAGERRKDERRRLSQYVVSQSQPRVSPRSYLSLLAFLLPLLFYLRSKTGQETDGEGRGDRRGTKKKRHGARLQV